MQAATSSDPQHVFVLDDDEGIVRLERKALERRGYRVTAASNLTAAEAAVAGDLPQLLVLDYSLAGTESGLDFYRRVRDRLGDLPAILVTGFSDEGRAIEALRAGIRDVIPKVGDYLDYLPDAVNRVLTQVRAARELAEAQAASRAKDRFLAILSHELRTPLTPVLTAVQMLQASPDLSPDAHETLALIRRNVEMEARLIDDLLDITRISRGKLILQESSTDLHEKLANAMRTIEDDVRGKQLTLVTDLRATRTRLSADPTRLQQVFWNLLKNAVKFTAEGGTVTVSTADAPNGCVRVEVADTGVGIAPAAIGRVFDAFEQGGAEITRQFGGLGLGLNISKALVEAHGGKIGVHSDGLGRGARFAVELPVRAAAPDGAGADPQIHPPDARVEGQQVSLKPRILLVEDHPDTAAMMAKILRRLGHHVTTADGVASALQVAASERFDVVVSDIGLPDGSGLDLMRQLLARHPVKGIALSGFGMEQDILRSRDAGFLEHLVKPIDIEQLKKTLQKITGK